MGWKLAKLFLFIVIYLPSNCLAYDSKILPPEKTEFFCFNSEAKECSDDEKVAHRYFKQILFLPTGYTESQQALYLAKVKAYITSLSLGGPNLFFEQHQKEILFYAAWLPGASIKSEKANFKGTVVFNHPFRGQAPVVDQTQVVEWVDQIAKDFLEPAAVVLLFRSDVNTTVPNAATPVLLNRSYGLVKVVDTDVELSYITIHELCHALFGFLDEYIEDGLQNTNIETLDALTPFVANSFHIQDQNHTTNFAAATLLGIHNFKVSEVLAANGSENTDVTSHPARVSVSNKSSPEFLKQGGMFFGKGVFHYSEPNIMGENEVIESSAANSDKIIRTKKIPSPELNNSKNLNSAGTTSTKLIYNGFAYAHSKVQQEVVDELFSHTKMAARANDRVSAVSLKKDWPFNFGNEVDVMVFDGDKNHRTHPTEHYLVETGHYQRVYHTCWRWIFPYACTEDRWVTEIKKFTADRMEITVNDTYLTNVFSSIQNTLCSPEYNPQKPALDDLLAKLSTSLVSSIADFIKSLNLTEFKNDGKTFYLCKVTPQELVEGMIPAASFILPYQKLTINTPQPMTDYFWRFKTFNGTYRSSWSAWNSVSRSL